MGFRNIIQVDGRTTSQPLYCFIDNEARDVAIAVTGDIPPERVALEMATYDESRGSAEFVVVYAVFEGGGISHNMSGGLEEWPNAWHILARRLKEGKYDPKGELIEFYMGHTFTCYVPEKHIKHIRTMQTTFI